MARFCLFNTSCSMPCPRLFVLIVLAAAAATRASAQDWFTVAGYPEIAGSDVVQISPALSHWNGQVTLEVRATRRADRTSYSGIPYRSYSGMAVVDCESTKGWFLTLTYYGEPNWQGQASKMASFKPDQAPMAFTDIPGEPAMKVIRAACAAAR